jgi:hypothetical protein
MNGQTYEALHVAREAIRYFDKPLEQLNETQIAAVTKLKDLKERKGHNSRRDILQRLGHTYAHKSVPKADMMYLLQIFNDLFFFGTLDAEFLWTERFDVEGAIGQYRYADRHTPARICMHVRQVDSNISGYDRFNGNVMSRLGTLLHEAAHAYLGQFACRRCSTYRRNLDAFQHGRAFQLLATKLEEKVVAFLDLPIETGRLSSYLSQWDKVTALPSQHDMVVWRAEEAARKQEERRLRQ